MKSKNNIAGADIITELSGIDSKFRMSAKYAGSEIAHSGQMLFDAVLEKALLSSGLAAERCAEACARAARKNPLLVKERQDKIIAAIKNNTYKRIRYFLADMLIYVKPSRKDARECAAIMNKWLEKEEGRGPRAAYLEGITAMADIEPKLRGMAAKLLETALKSPVPSYSARARQIIAGKKRK